MAKKWLLADVGGTHVRFSVYEGGTVLAPVKYRINAFERFEQALTAYFEQEKITVDGFVIGAAGAKKNNVVRLTNYPWEIDANRLQLQFKLSGVYLVNDFVLQGLGIIECTGVDLISFGPKPDSAGARAVIGAGTGLGVCFLVPEKEKHWRVFESEGGHMSPGCLQGAMALIIQAALQKEATLSFERFVSGPGLLFLYRLLREHYADWRQGALIDELRSMKAAFGALLSKEASFKEVFDPLDVTRLAQTGDELALMAWWLFFKFLGVFCSDVAVLFKTTGGVYLVGDMLNHSFVRIMLEKSGIRQTFEAKEQLSGFLRGIPLFLVTKKDVPLSGLKYIAGGLSA